jgi:hypothetical protein
MSGEEKPKRRGGCQTVEAKRKAGDAMRNHRKIRQSAPELCQVCGVKIPIDHVLVDGVRTWMCSRCFNMDSPLYLSEELERHTYAGVSNLGCVRGG